MLWSSPHTIRNIFYSESSNMKYPLFYPQCHQSVVLFQDKASSNTSQSTVNFLKKNGTRIGYQSLLKLLMNFRVFGILKNDLSNLPPFMGIGSLFVRNEKKYLFRNYKIVMAIIVQKCGLEQGLPNFNTFKLQICYVKYFSKYHENRLKILRTPSVEECTNN